MYTYRFGYWNLDDINDVNAGAPNDNDVLTYNSATGEWEPAVAAAGASALGDLTDVTDTTSLEWPGPFVVTTGTGAPSAGTGNEGEYYIDTTTPFSGVLYGPKTGGSWPLIGNQNVVYAGGFTPPVGNAVNGLSYFVQVLPVPPYTTPTAVYGPYDAAGKGERSVVSHDMATQQWKWTNDEFVVTNDGGNHKAKNASGVTGNFVVNPSDGTFHRWVLTGNTTLYNAAIGVTTFSRPRISTTSRASSMILVIEQGGSGGYTVTWPSNISWPGGVTPVLSTRVGDIDVFQVTTYDNGTTWVGSMLSQGASRNNVETVETKTTDYTFTRADIGNIVVLNDTNNRTFTIPTNASVPLPIGARITVAAASTGHITIAGAVGVTLSGVTLINTQGEIADIIKIGTDTWVTHH